MESIVRVLRVSLSASESTLIISARALPFFPSTSPLYDWLKERLDAELNAIPGGEIPGVFRRGLQKLSALVAETGSGHLV
jgi:hypothetical protein